MDAEQVLDTERRLIHLSFWPVRALQCIGYFPHRIKDGRLVATRFNFLTFWAALLTCVSIYMTVHFALNPSFNSEWIKLDRPTDLFAYAAFVVSIHFVSACTRFSAIVNASELQTHWQEMCTKMSEVVSTEAFSINSGSKYGRLFEAIRLRCKWSTIAVISFLVVLSVPTIWSNVNQTLSFAAANGTEPPNMLYFAALLIYSNCSLFLHGISCIWICFCLRTIGGLLRMVQLELRDFKAIAINKDVKELDAKSLEHSLDSFRIIQELLQESNMRFQAYITADIVLFIVISITFSFFGIYWVGVNGDWKMTSGSVVFVSVYFFRILNYVSVAQDISSTGKGIAVEVQGIYASRDELGEGLKFKVELMVLKATLDPPRVSPGYYYEVSHKLLTSMMGTFTTYLIFLIQFRQMT